MQEQVQHVSRIQLSILPVIFTSSEELGAGLVPISKTPIDMPFSST